MSNLEIKQGENKFYIGDDENHALAEITYRLWIIMKLTLIIQAYLMNLVVKVLAKTS